MDRFPKFLGYAGALPFMLCLAGLIYFDEDLIRTKFFNVLQICYAGMIVSFLVGTHWPAAVKDKDNIRLSLSMVPTIVSAILLFYGFSIDPLYPILVMIPLFWFVYAMDHFYVTALDMSIAYKAFRLNITILVSILLLASFGFSL